MLTGLDTKGLEFDGIVVVRPEEIEAESATGRVDALRRAHPRHPAADHGRLRRQPSVSRRVAEVRDARGRPGLARRPRSPRPAISRAPVGVGVLRAPWPSRRATSAVRDGPSSTAIATQELAIDVRQVVECASRATSAPQPLSRDRRCPCDTASAVTLVGRRGAPHLVADELDQERVALDGRRPPRAPRLGGDPAAVALRSCAASASSTSSTTQRAQGRARSARRRNVEHVVGQQVGDGRRRGRPSTERELDGPPGPGAGSAAASSRRSGRAPRRGPRRSVTSSPRAARPSASSSATTVLPRSVAGRARPAVVSPATRRPRRRPATPVSRRRGHGRLRTRAAGATSLVAAASAVPGVAVRLDRVSQPLGAERSLDLVEHHRSCRRHAAPVNRLIRPGDPGAVGDRLAGRASSDARSGRSARAASAPVDGRERVRHLGVRLSLDCYALA